MVFKEVKNQILATVIGNIVSFAGGTSVGWFSPILPLLRSENTPLTSGPLTTAEIGWIGSLPSLGGILATILCAYLSKFIGFRKALLALAIPLSISWIIIIFTTSSWLIFISRLLLGLGGGGVFLVLPQYVAEIADEHIRGQLNSYIQVSCYLGVLSGYIGGSYLDYYTNPLIMLMIPIIFGILFAFMPDTPQFLLHKNCAEQAEKSLRFYRNCYSGSMSKAEETKFKVELNKLIAIAEQNDQQASLCLADFYDRSVIKAFTIGIALLIVSQWSGSFVLSTYAVTVFRDTGSTFDARISAIVMVILQIFGTYLASILIDRMGRKTLLIISNVGASSAMFITGVYVYLGKNGYDISEYNLLPVISLSFFIFICALGVLTVPFVILTEIMPQKMRKTGCFICTMISFIFQSLALKLFPFLLDTLGLSGSLFCFASVTAFGALFACVVVQETKGTNLDVFKESRADEIELKPKNQQRF